MTSARRLLFLLVLALVTATAADAQLTMDPPRPILTSKERSLELRLSNPSSSTVEVNAEALFIAYRADSLGRFYTDTMSTPEERLVSAADWLKVFPRRFNMPPGSQRIVRLIASIPPSTADGEYWATLRFSTETKETIKPLVDTLDTNGIGTVRMGMTINALFPVSVRVGELQTGVQIDRLEALVDTARTLLLFHARSTGNASYRGTFVAKVKGSDGSEVGTAEGGYTLVQPQPCAVQFPRLADGIYTVDVNVESKRKGTVAETVIPAAPVSRSYRLTVNGGRASVEDLTQ